MAIFVGSVAVGALGLWLPNGALWSFESQTAQAATNCAGGGSSIASGFAAPTPCTSGTALNAGNPNWQLAALTAVEPEESPKRLDLRTSLQSDDGFAPSLPKRERFAASVGSLRIKPGEEPVALASIEGPTPEAALLDDVDPRDHELDLCGAGGGGLTSGDCDHPAEDDGGKDDDGGEHHDDGGEHADGDGGEHHDDGGEGGEHGDDHHDGGEGGERGDDHADNDGDRDCNEGGGREEHADGRGDDHHDGGERGERDGREGGEGGERGRDGRG